MYALRIQVFDFSRASLIARHAFVAFGAHALIWSRPTGCRFCSAGIDPSIDPSAAKTNEFSPTSTGLSESRLQLFIQTAAPVKLDTARKTVVPISAPDTILPNRL